MAVQRDDPYGAFNFLVNLNRGAGTECVLAGFQGVTGLNTEETQAEYRNGNEKVNRVRKITGMYNVGVVTLRRGLIGATDLFDWISETRKGDPAAPRSVTIFLRDEAGRDTVMTWRL